MRISSLTLVAAALLAVAPHEAEAQTRTYIGPTLAWNDDVDLGIGATIGFNLPSIDPRAGFMGDLLIFFPDGYDYQELNANGTWDFAMPNSTATPFVLTGLNFTHTSVEVDGVNEGNTDLHLNLGGGIAFNAGAFRPRVGARFILTSGSPLVVFGTLPFSLGGGA